MDEATLLLRAYYELLYELLCANRGSIANIIKQLLSEEIEKRYRSGFDSEKYTAYCEASLAVIDERIETYNPTGIQYTYEPARISEAFKLEFELSWYGGESEFNELTKTARRKAEFGMSEHTMCKLAGDCYNNQG